MSAIEDRINARLNAVLALPVTHYVVSTWDSGEVRRYGARSYGSAKAYAENDSRRIGKPLISRETGEIVRLLTVEIVEA